MESLTLISGTKEDDVLSGTSGTDILLGGNGEDVLDGGAGNDLLSGGNGEDTLYGGDGNDLLSGGNGSDSLDGGAGNDLLDGGNGNDSLDGGSGSDIVLAGNGNDDANFTWSENTDSTNYYDGGKGFDTLQLTLTSAELELAQEDIAAFNAFLKSGGYIFQFQSFDLTVRNFEALVFNIVGGNVAPEAIGNIYEASEDVALTISGPGVLGNDIDAEGATLIAALVTGPTNGTVTLNSDGSFTYTPDADFFGADSFTYKANDGALDSDVATVTLQVAAVNDKPVAADDTFGTDEDVPLLDRNVFGNDKDVDNDALSAKVVAGPQHGTLVFNTDGSFSYTADADFFGADYFTYQANDGALESDVATVTLQVAAVNDAPVAVDDDIAGTAGGAGPIRVAVVGGSASTYEDAAKQLDGSSTDFKFAADGILVTTFATKAEWLTKLANYDVVVVGENGGASDYEGSQLFAALRDFVDAGGGVVTTGWFAGEIAAYSDAAMRADADYISPAASSLYSFYTGVANPMIDVLDASHPIAGGIDDYAVQGYTHELAGAVDNTVDAKATVLATGGADGLAAIAYDEVGTNGGLTVFLGSLHMSAPGFFRPEATRGDAVDQIFEQAVAWAAGEQEKGTASTDEDTARLIDVAQLLDNDSDKEGNTLAIDSVAAKSKLGAAVSINADGNIVYDPAAALQYLNAGEIVDDSFWYEVSDGKGGVDTGTINVTVAGLADSALGGTGDDASSLGLGTPDADVLL